jgi:hypothetical protein
MCSINTLNKWEGIPFNRCIAEIKVKESEITDWMSLKGCLKAVYKNPNNCLGEPCVIAELIIALVIRGADFPKEILKKGDTMEEWRGRNQNITLAR